MTKEEVTPLFSQPEQQPQFVARAAAGSQTFIYTFKPNQVQMNFGMQIPQDLRIVCRDKQPPLICANRIEEADFRRVIVDIEDKLTRAIQACGEELPQHVGKCCLFTFGCFFCTFGLSAIAFAAYMVGSIVSAAGPIKKVMNDIEIEVQNYLERENVNWQQRGLRWKGRWIQTTSVGTDYNNGSHHHNTYTNTEFQLEVEVLV